MSYGPEELWAPNEVPGRWARDPAPSLTWALLRFLPLTAPLAVFAVVVGVLGSQRPDELLLFLLAMGHVVLGALVVPWLVAASVVCLDRVPDLRSVSRVAPRSGTPLSHYAMVLGLLAVLPPFVPYMHVMRDVPFLPLKPFLPFMAFVLIPLLPDLVVALDEEVDLRSARALMRVGRPRRLATMLMSGLIACLSFLLGVTLTVSGPDYVPLSVIPQTIGVALLMPYNAWMLRRPPPAPPAR